MVVGTETTRQEKEVAMMSKMVAGDAECARNIRYMKPKLIPMRDKAEGLNLIIECTAQQ